MNNINAMYISNYLQANQESNQCPARSR